MNHIYKQHPSLSSVQRAFATGSPQQKTSKKRSCDGYLPLAGYLTSFFGVADFVALLPWYLDIGMSRYGCPVDFALLRVIRLVRCTRALENPHTEIAERASSRKDRAGGHAPTRARRNRCTDSTFCVRTCAHKRMKSRLLPHRRLTLAATIPLRRRVLQLEHFTEAFTLIDDVFRECKDTLVATSFLAVIIWVGAAYAFFLTEKGNPNVGGAFDNIPNSLYYT